MKNCNILIITDLEGVAGVLNFDDWCVPEGRRNEVGCRFLTGETNAAVRAFFDGGATGVTVLDAHGSGGSIRGEILDPRARLQRGVGPDWPACGSEYQAIAFVGQHAKSRTDRAHLSHTQMFDAIDFSINGVSIGEYGQLVWCAAEEQLATIFASGDASLAAEVIALTPEAEFAAVKWGLNHPSKPEAGSDEAKNSQLDAVHLSPEAAQAVIYAQALRAVKKFLAQPAAFQTNLPGGPYQATALYRPTGAEMTALVGALPARQIRTRRHERVMDVMREFYREIEWIMPDGDRVTAR